MKMYQLVIAQDCDVNIASSQGTHMYLPGIKAGHQLAYSSDMKCIESWQQFYSRHGYGTKINTIADEGAVS